MLCKKKKKSKEEAAAGVAGDRARLPGSRGEQQKATGKGPQEREEAGKEERKDCMTNEIGV